MYGRRMVVGAQCCMALLLDTIVEHHPLLVLSALYQCASRGTSHNVEFHLVTTCIPGNMIQLKLDLASDLKTSV